MQHNPTPREMVREFHEAFGHPVNKSFISDTALQELRFKLIDEELKEAYDALTNIVYKPYDGCEADFLKEMCDVVYVTLGASLSLGVTVWSAIPVVYEIGHTQPSLSYIHFMLLDLRNLNLRCDFTDEENTKDTLDLILQMAYIITSTLGYSIYPAFQEVHRSNMSKLGEDGKPVRRPDGKVLKGLNYKEPDLTPFV